MTGLLPWPHTYTARGYDHADSAHAGEPVGSTFANPCMCSARLGPGRKLAPALHLHTCTGPSTTWTVQSLMPPRAGAGQPGGSTLLSPSVFFVKLGPRPSPHSAQHEAMAETTVQSLTPTAQQLLQQAPAASACSKCLQRSSACSKRVYPTSAAREHTLRPQHATPTVLATLHVYSAHCCICPCWPP